MAWLVGFGESLYRGGWELNGLCLKMQVAITNNDSSRTNYTNEQFHIKINCFLEPYYVIILLQVGFYLTNGVIFSIYCTVNL